MTSRRNLVIAAIVLLIAAFFVFSRFGRSSAAQFQTATVTRGPITQAVTATGTLNPVVNVQVGSQVSGNIQKLFADFNSKVKAGDVVAQIDPVLFQATVTQAEGDLANAQAAWRLRQRHNIRAGRDDDFTVRNQQEIAEAATATADVMAGLLGAIAGVSLVVGGIGIMNIMLVSVTERTREIGTRMAVGAHSRDILTQFLIEAVSLSSVGGLLGIILGIVASKILSAIKHWPSLISPGSIVLAFLFSAAVGIFFGFYPARKAAALDPIEALRYE